LAYNHNDAAFDAEIGPNLSGAGLIASQMHYKPPVLCPVA